LTETRTLLTRRLTGVALAGALLALAGCSDSGGGGGSTATTMPSMTSATASSSASASASSGTSTAANQVVIKNFAFTPATLTVRAGATVTVMNQDSTAHTLTATGAKEFDTGSIAPGKSATFTAPAKAGSYSYSCTIHPFMKGSLTVS
jgi:plastocyanin